MDEQVKPVNFGRHAAERINWKSPAAIAKQYRLANRASVYAMPKPQDFTIPTA